MFKRVLLCDDGSEVGRRALRRGAELAILVRAQVYVLSIIPDGVADAAYLNGGQYMIDVAGDLLPATVHLKAPYDPRSERVKR